MIARESLNPGGWAADAADARPSAARATTRRIA